MKIIFSGKSSPIKYFSVGVQNNNLVDVLEFEIDRHTPEGTDLSTLVPFVKLQNDKQKYIDKDGRLEVVTTDEKINLTYQLRRKTTMYAWFDVQLQFEHNNGTDLVVWQTDAITITLARTIPADDEIIRQHPAVIQDLTSRVEKLEKDGGGSITQIKIINGGTP